jgi:hypothetical protein
MQKQTYLNLLDLLFRLGKQAIVNPMYANSLTNSTYERTKANVHSHRIPQPLVMSDTSLFGKCTHGEWALIGQISEELKEYNCLWYCSPELKKNTRISTCIKGLIVKDILRKTETTHIYIVNPFYLRRGDLFAVLTTTAATLANASKVGLEHITNKKPVSNFEFINPLNNRQISYGFADDTDGN